MKSVWSGAISFGLVNIPVKLYSATGDDYIDLDMLAKQDLSPIRYARIAVSDGREVAFKDIVKGYEIEKGKYVVLNEEDFKNVNSRKNNLIEIVNFVNEDEIDSVYFEKPYFLEPDKNAAKPYALLREALRKSKKTGIATFVLKHREHIGAIKISGDVIILNQLRYTSNIRSADQLNLPEKSSVSPKEIEMGIKLIEQLTEKFNPANYKDTYVDELKKVLDLKAKGKSVAVKNKISETTHIKDLMSVIKASLESVKGRKAQDRSPVRQLRTIKKQKTVKHKKLNQKK